MRNAGGYALIREPGKADRECDTFTCKHCNNIVHVPTGANPDDLGGFCRMCMGHICARCADSGECTPFERQLERIEARDRLRREL